MKHREYIPEIYDWICIRQALSLALARKIPVNLKGAGDFLSQNEEYLPLIHDITGACEKIGAGALVLQGPDVIFSPDTISPGRYSLEAGPFSSSVEMLLFFIPALFTLSARTVLDISGPTHSVLSYPTSFVKEALYPLLERAGLYASISLKRFGFYGSGGGIIEARAYPAENKKSEALSLSGEGKIEGARIFAAGINVEMAKREKARICGALSIPEERVSILEIRDADGFGNTLQVYCSFNDTMIVLYREMKIYNHAGDLVLDEENFNAAIDEVVAEAGTLLKNPVMPLSLYRELVPLCGPDIVPEATALDAGPGLKESLALFHDLL